MIYMISKIVAIQGNHPKELSPISDTSVFLANEAQNKKYKIFYYEPKNLSIINDTVVANGFFIQFDYSNKKFFKILKLQKLNLLNCKFILIRQDPPFNLEYISTTYILDKIKNKVQVINSPTSIRNISEKLYSSNYQKFMPKTIFTKNIKEIKNFYRINKKIINNPTSIRNISEKLYSSTYQKFMPKTIFTKDLREIKKFYNINKKIIIKPIHGFGGNDIHLITKNLCLKLFLLKT